MSALKRLFLLVFWIHQSAQRTTVRHIARLPALDCLSTKFVFIPCFYFRYEKCGTHRVEVPRMYFEERESLEKYILNTKKDDQ